MPKSNKVAPAPEPTKSPKHDTMVTPDRLSPADLEAIQRVSPKTFDSITKRSTTGAAFVGVRAAAGSHKGERGR